MMVLFVCRANLHRSPRAAEVFKKLTDQKGLDIEVQSAGTNVIFEGDDPQALNAAFGVDHVTQLTNEILKKAGIIVAFGRRVEQEIKTSYQSTATDIITLGVPDEYSKGRGNLDELYKILHEKLGPLVEEISLSQGKRSSKEVL